MPDNLKVNYCHCHHSKHHECKTGNINSPSFSERALYFSGQLFSFQSVSMCFSLSVRACIAAARIVLNWTELYGTEWNEMKRNDETQRTKASDVCATHHVCLINNQRKLRRKSKQLSIWTISMMCICVILWISPFFSQCKSLQ